MKSRLPVALVAFFLPLPAFAAEEEGPPDATMIPVEVDEEEPDEDEEAFEDGVDEDSVDEEVAPKPKKKRRRRRRRRRAETEEAAEPTPTPTATEEAEDDEASDDEELADANWGLALSMGVMGLGGGAVSPMISGTFERRVGDGVFLVTVVHASGVAAHSEGEYEDEYYSGNVGGDLGLRGVLYDGPVEASLQGVARGYYGDTQSLYFRDRGWEVSLVSSLILQHHFTDWFALRVSTDLFSVGYGESSSEGAPEYEQRTRWHARLSPNPQIGARIAF